MLTVSELNDLSVEDLKKQLLELRETQFKLRLQKANGSLEKMNQFKLVRRSIARVKTIMTQKAGLKDDK